MASHEHILDARRLRAKESAGVAIDAVIFDLDGVLIDSEGLWDTARQEIAAGNGGQWTPDATRAMIGMSSTEWSRYMHDQLGVQLAPERISDAVVSRLKELYRQQVPVTPGAREVVIALAEHYRLGLASSANRPIIEFVLEQLDLTAQFAVTVSSEEVARGKPAPDVYSEAVERLGAVACQTAAVEDSGNGIRSAAAAGLHVFAVPNRHFPPGSDALALADEVLDSLTALTPERVAGAT